MDEQTLSPNTFNIELIDDTRLTPLIVDLDGTLTPTDTLVESVIELIRQSPFYFIRLPLWLLKGRAGFKEAVANRVRIDAQSLPYNIPLLTYLGTEKSKGRQIVLATAAHHSIAAAVATHLDLFDEVIATQHRQNIKGCAKLAAIQQKVGETFVYAGDSKADIPIWRAAEGAILVGVSKRLADKIRRDRSIWIEREFERAINPRGSWSRILLR
ncbi:MAG: haloacid dehalogenase-like hydrolase [Candidatus Competibacteraceae bacterium]|jgi:phosphoserine phosphatase|nr:haloacid dehalogenase-like hydrolase [Candidatus Competibacteraceae bacterium]